MREAVTYALSTSRQAPPASRKSPDATTSPAYYGRFHYEVQKQVC